MNVLFPYMARWKTINWTRYHQLLINLAETGHQVYVIQPPKSDMPETNFQEIDVELQKNLHLIDLELNAGLWNRKFPLNKLVKKGYYSLACVKKIRELIKDKKIDAVILYNIPQYFIDTGSCLTIFDYADDYLDMLKKELGPLSNPLVLKLGETLLRNMIQRADVTLAVSHVLADSIRKWDPNVVVLPNGAALAEGERTASVGFTRPAGRKVVGFVGSFEYFIDFDLVLSTAKTLPQHIFLLVGGGREFGRVKAEAERLGLNNVVLTGPVPHSKIAGYIREMDVCLNIFKKMPVSHGACPIKMFEYLIMKKPVITTRLDEIERIDEKFVFYADTPKETAERIEYIFDHAAIAGEYARRGYEITVRDYSWDKIAHDFMQIVERAKVLRSQSSVTTLCSERQGQILSQ